MIWIDVAKKVMDLGAPLLGMAIAGPSGANFLSYVCHLFDSPAYPEGLLDKIANDKDASQKLIDLQGQHYIDLQKIALDQAKIEFDHEEKMLQLEEQDVQDARKMEMLTHDWMPKFIALSITLSLMTALILFFFHPISSENREIVIGIIVLFGWQYLNMCRFYLGGKIPSIDDIKKLKK